MRCAQVKCGPLFIAGPARPGGRSDQAATGVLVCVLVEEAAVLLRERERESMPRWWVCVMYHPLSAAGLEAVCVVLDYRV